MHPKFLKKAVLSFVLSVVAATTAQVFAQAPDTNAPTLFRADGSASLTNVTVSFSERLDPETATNAANYRITNTMNVALAVTRAVLSQNTNVILTTAVRDANLNYILYVSGVNDASNNTIRANSPAAISSVVPLVTFTSGWNYNNPLPGIDELNLGTAWREPGYVLTSSWASNAAAGFFLDFDPNVVFPLPKNTELSQGAITSYYRKHFNYTASISGARLLLRHCIADGAVFYLNGQEILRVRVPLAPAVITYQTVGTAANPIITPGTNLPALEVPATALRSGANVLAVELHGASAQEIILFMDAQLSASIASLNTGPVIILTQPTNQTVIEGQPVSVTLNAVAANRFQWRRNGTNIVGATNAVLTIPSVPGSFNGSTFSSVVSNTGGGAAATSSNMTLTVISDTNRPVLLSASAGSAPNTILVSFSEPIDPVTGVALANYRLTDSAGQTVAVQSISLTNATNAVLAVPNLAWSGLGLVINDVRDASATANLIAPNSCVTIGFRGTFVDFTTTEWRYDDTGANLGTAWRAVAFNDSSWLRGTGVIGAPVSEVLPGGNIVRTVIAPYVDTRNTYYFRTHFNFSGPTTNFTMTASNLIDDGAVFYLNGNQIARVAMNATAVITNGSLSTRATDIGDAGRGFDVFNFGSSNLVQGDNVLAVEVHQGGATSSDIIFGSQIFLNRPSSVCTPTNPLPTNVALTITNVAGEIRITWPAATGLVLQQTSEIRGTNTPWADVTPPVSTPPYNTPASGPARFYRLIQR